MPPSATEVLRTGTLEVMGRFADSSNATLLVRCRLGGEDVGAVYKPERGERPLWDFPPGLWRREIAAYRLSEALGWHLVPLTVERSDGPYGIGSLQLLVPEDGTSHYFTVRDVPAHQPQLMRIAALDVIMNNADRKSGHVLLAEDRIWAIDHGLCFHVEDKLRTVIWEFAGRPLPAEVSGSLVALAERGIPDDVSDLLSSAEHRSLSTRVGRLAACGLLPEPAADGDWPPYPWPLV